MNINSIINPISCGNYRWSVFLPVRKQLYGQYDGFNYLGVGVILLIVFVIIVGVVFNRKYMSSVFKSNVVVFAICIFLTLFAISNIMCFDGKEIFVIKIPNMVENLCGIFRASSRLFYPVFYIILLFGIVFEYRIINIKLEKRDKKRVMNLASIILLFFAMVQLLDLSGVVLYKHKEMKLKCNNDINIPKTLLSLDDYDVMFVSEQWGSRYQSIIAAYNCMYTNGIDTNTRSDAHLITDEFTTKTLEDLNNGLINLKYVYSTRSLEEFIKWKYIYGKRASYIEWNLADIPNSQIWEGSKKIYYMIPRLNNN